MTEPRLEPGIFGEWPPPHLPTPAGEYIKAASDIGPAAAVAAAQKLPRAAKVIQDLEGLSDGTGMPGLIRGLVVMPEERRRAVFRDLGFEGADLRWTASGPAVFMDGLISGASVYPAPGAAPMQLMPSGHCLVGIPCDTCASGGAEDGN